MRIGIFGGTYNPVHLGHIWTARAVRDELSLDKLYMVVSADPPHKPDPERLPGSIRYRMLDLSLEGERGIFPSDVELKREGKSYTVDTLSWFKGQYRGAELFFVVGGDMLENFPEWREPEKILSMAKLVAVGRPDEVRNMEGLARDIEERFGGKVILSAFSGPDMSSTEVRRRMFEAEPVNAFVKPAVEKYLYLNAVYMPREFVEIRSRLSKILKKKRLEHTMLTACEAVKLAAHYGADAKKARLAAILHDCIKLPNKELVAYCDNNSYEISQEERENPYLIHSRLGAEFAQTEYGIDDPEILAAIRSHTIGRIGMSLLEKIIYLADKLEPSRDFKGVEAMRRTAYEDINKAMLMVMRHSAEYTAASGRSVNPSTEEVMNYLKNEVKNGPEVHNG